MEFFAPLRTHLETSKKRVIAVKDRFNKRMIERRPVLFRGRPFLKCRESGAGAGNFSMTFTPLGPKYQGGIIPLGPKYNGWGVLHFSRYRGIISCLIVVVIKEGPSNYKERNGLAVCVACSFLQSRAFGHIACLFATGIQWR